MGTEAAKVARALSSFTSRLTSRVAIRTGRFLVANTPRDTNFAASNWVASIGSPFAGIIGSKAAVSFSFQESSFASLNRYKVGRGKIFLVNNVDYIGKLDGGSSSQAPRGFVRTSINSAIRSVL